MKEDIQYRKEITVSDKSFGEIQSQPIVWELVIPLSHHYT